MADGQTIERTRLFKHVLLIDAKDDAADGVWIDVSSYVYASIELVLTDTGTVQVRGSDSSTRPLNSADGVQIGSNITTNSITNLASLPRWIKVKVTAAGQALSVLGVFRRA